MKMSSSQQLDEHFAKNFAEQFRDVTKKVKAENKTAADITGDLFLEVLNKDTFVSFSSGGGACQTRSFVSQEACHEKA